MLNAKPENVERESEIVAQAGRLGAVTVATNMAGRGTDIVLGGSAKGIATAITKYLMLHKLGLFSIPLDFVPESESEPETSSELQEGDDEVQIVEETDPDVLSLPNITLLSKYLDISLPKQLKQTTEINLKRAVISVLDMLGDKSDKLAVEDVIAQSVESIPTTNTDLKRLRFAMAEMITYFDKILKKESDVVKNLGTLSFIFDISQFQAELCCVFDLGGLYVVGTSRHESRRIDQQLRGRAGRQGDPGGTRFFLSLEDDLFKIFGADKMTGMMDNFRVAEDMPIESDLVVQALDKIQIQVEDYFRANRMQVCEYLEAR